MKWADFLHADTNFGKLNINLVIIGWDHETQKPGVLTNGLMNQADWVNNFSMLAVVE